MLYLIGIGLWDENDISLKGLAALIKCDSAYAESYTSQMKDGTLSRLSGLSGKKIVLLSREQVEDGKELVKEAKSKNIAFLTAGDPMVSTTHVSLLMDAKKAKVGTKIIHSSSILSAAIGASGLQTYKFGKPVTLAYWTENYKPTSTYDTIRENHSRGLHTLLFLDLKDGKPMPPKHALDLLLRLGQEAKGSLLNENTKLILLSRIGADEEKITHGTIKALKSQHDLGETPAIIVLPGKLHFMEEEFLASL